MRILLYLGQNKMMMDDDNVRYEDGLSATLPFSATLKVYVALNFVDVKQLCIDALLHRRASFY